MSGAEPAPAFRLWRPACLSALFWHSLILSILCSVSAPGCALERLWESSLALSFFFPSPAIPQFGLLSHTNSLRLSSGHSGPVLTLSNAARASLISPRSFPVDASVWVTSPLGVVIRYVICGLFFFFFLSLLVTLPSEIPKTPHRPAGERVSWCLETALPS